MNELIESKVPASQAMQYQATLILCRDLSEGKAIRDPGCKFVAKKTIPTVTDRMRRRFAKIGKHGDGFPMRPLSDNSFNSISNELEKLKLTGE